jgi:hypothetical protein
LMVTWPTGGVFFHSTSGVLEAVHMSCKGVTRVSQQIWVTRTVTMHPLLPPCLHHSLTALPHHAARCPHPVTCHTTLPTALTHSSAAPPCPGQSRKHLPPHPAR